MLQAALIAFVALVEPPPPTVSIVWTAPQECPSQTEIETAIVELSGARLGRTSADLIARATVVAHENRYVCELALVRGAATETRTLEAETCALLGRLTTVVVAVALDPVTAITPPTPPVSGHPTRPPLSDTPRPRATSRDPEPNARITPADPDPSPADTPPEASGSNPDAHPPAAEEGEPEPPRDPDPDASPVGVDDGVPEARGPSAADTTHLGKSSAAKTEGPPPAQVSAPSSAVDARFEAGGTLGVLAGGLILPGVGAGVRASGFFGGRRALGQVVAQYWFPRRITSDARDDAGARLQQFSLGLRGCPYWDRGRWRISACTGPDLGFMQGRGEGPGLTQQRSALSLWAGWAFSVGVHVALSPRVALGALVEAEVSMVRPEFSLDGIAGSLHRAGTVGPQGGFEIIFRRSSGP